MRLKKWEYGLIAGLILILSGIVYGQVCRSESITIANTAIGLTATTYLRARYAYGVVEQAPIRWTTDPNITVTSELGLKQNSMGVIILDSPDKIKNFRAIRIGATSGILQILYFD